MNFTCQPVTRTVRRQAFLLLFGIMSVMNVQRVEARGVATHAATKTISISSYAYHAPAVTVKRGTTVVWTNKDAALHTVSFTAGRGVPSDSGDLRQGSTFRHRFAASGVFRYHCAYHAFMTGVVKVTR